jgi:hypothetical protein
VAETLQVPAAAIEAVDPRKAVEYMSTMDKENRLVVADTTGAPKLGDRVSGDTGRVTDLWHDNPSSTE